MIVKCIQAFTKLNDNTTVNTYMDNNDKIHKITSKQMLKQIRLAAAAHGKDILGFSPNSQAFLYTP
jgi:hypothetical protein